MTPFMIIFIVKPPLLYCSGRTRLVIGFQEDFRLQDIISHSPSCGLYFSLLYPYNTETDDRHIEIFSTNLETQSQKGTKPNLAPSWYIYIVVRQKCQSRERHKTAQLFAHVFDVCNVY